MAFAILVIPSLRGKPFVPGEIIRGDFKQIGELFLENHCFDCHDDETKEADLNLLDLGPVDEINAAVWKSVWAQVAMGEMPPPEQISAQDHGTSQILGLGSSGVKRGNEGEGWLQGEPRSQKGKLSRT
ncbi:hypothetical protein N8920_02375 [Opitutales bacterium]|nr:hypothetical protein [Opitutales bacterium]